MTGRRKYNKKITAAQTLRLKEGQSLDLLEKLEKMEQTEERFEKETPERTARRISVLTVAAVFLTVLAAGILYVSRSNIIYFWDDSTYWDMSRSVAEGGIADGFWRNVYGSIGTSDYNYVAALPSAAWALVFGKSREAFVAGLIVMYLLPAMILLFRLAKKISKAPRFAFAAAVLIMPAAAFLAFAGFADVGGLLIAVACYNLYYTSEGTAEQWYRYIAIGVLLVLIMVFRRYFAFFAVSFLTAMAVDCIVFRKKWRYLFITAAVCAVLLLTVFRPFLTGILLRDYGTLYSSYQYSVGTDMKLITRYFGLLLLLAAFAVPFAAGIRKREFRPVFLWLQMLVCAAMFMATQTHGQQHLLLYVPALAVLMLFMVNCISKQWMLIAVCALAAVNVVNTYIPREQPGNIQEIKHIAVIPNFSMLPRHRDDTEAILTLKRDLDAAVPDGSSCGILSSSFLLNDSILRNAEVSLNAGITRDAGYIRSLPEVDSRDGDRLGEIYTSDYILAAVPAQTHLAAGEQTIVDEAVTSFVRGTDIAEAFAADEGFTRTIGDIEVRLYHRIDDVGAYQRSVFEARLFY